MSIVIVPDEVKSKLARAADRVEVCSTDGVLLGYFTPTPPKQYRLEPPDISEAELDRRETAGGGRPLAEILRDLEARG